MARPTFNLDDLADALKEVQVTPAETVVMHSSLRDLGWLADTSLREYPARIIAAVREFLGPDGTLAVPAANWDYGRAKEPFDIRHSPVARELGVVGSHMISVPDAERSPNPIFAVAAVGKEADFICNSGTATAFGTDSAWDRMFQKDADMLFLGCDLTYLTFARYIEQHFGVPYLYNKLFDVPVLDNGKPLGLEVTAPLRFMSCPAEYDLSRFEERLRDSGCLRETRLGAGAVKAVKMLPCFEMGVAALKSDIHYFLKETPAYQPGEVPIA